MARKSAWQEDGACLGEGKGNSPGISKACGGGGDLSGGSCHLLPSSVGGQQGKERGILIEGKARLTARSSTHRRKSSDRVGTLHFVARSTNAWLLLGSWVDFAFLHATQRAPSTGKCVVHLKWERRSWSNLGKQRCRILGADIKCTPCCGPAQPRRAAEKCNPASVLWDQ